MKVSVSTDVDLIGSSSIYNLYDTKDKLILLTLHEYKNNILNQYIP